MNSPQNNTNPSPQDGSHTDALRQEYLEKKQIAAELAGKDHQYATSVQVTKQRQIDLEKTTTSLKHAQQLEEKTAKIVHKVQKNKVQQKVFPKKAKEKLNKVNHNHFQAKEAASNAELLRKEAEKNLKVATEEQKNLQGKAETLQAVQKRRAAILHLIFDGPSGTSEENDLENKRNYWQQSLIHLKKSAADSEKALALLTSALNHLTYAARALRNAQLSNTVDLFTDGGIGLIAGAGSQINLQKASKLAQQAREKVNAALALNPALPVAKYAKVKNGFLNVFVDIALDNIVADAVTRYKIEKAVKSVKAATADVQRSVQVQQEVVGRVKADFANANYHFVAVEGELFRLREQLLQEGAL